MYTQEIVSYIKDYNRKGSATRVRVSDSIFIELACENAWAPGPAYLCGTKVEIKPGLPDDRIEIRGRVNSRIYALMTRTPNVYSQQIQSPPSVPTPQIAPPTVHSSSTPVLQEIIGFIKDYDTKHAVPSDTVELHPNVWDVLRQEIGSTVPGPGHQILQVMGRQVLSDPTVPAAVATVLASGVVGGYYDYVFAQHPLQNNVATPQVTPAPHIPPRSRSIIGYSQVYSQAYSAQPTVGHVSLVYGEPGITGNAPAKAIVCECGSDAVGSPKHSGWCPKC